jgi:GxxExxY protein
MLREPEREVDHFAYAVIGAAIEVHRHLGPGFLESIYESALMAELSSRSIPFERQKTVPLMYKGQSVGMHRLDLLVGRQVVVELKAVDAVAPIHFAQMISYLAATRLPLGLLINFHVRVLKDGIHRIIRSDAAA